MANGPEVITARVQAAAARTSAAGSARLSSGLHHGAPTLEVRDRLTEGVVDFAARRALVSERLLSGSLQDDLQSAPEAFIRPRELLYDGAIQLMRSGDSWLAFTDVERDGPRSHLDPLWPMDALFGAGDDVIVAGTDTIRDVTTTHYQFTVDLVAADDRLLTGIEVPEGPLRRLRRLPAEVWLDDAGRARRIAIQNAAGDRQVWKVLELWDFGVAVAITPPGPDQVTTPDPVDLPRILMGDG